jgi:CHAD domain-containing protein
MSAMRAPSAGPEAAGVKAHGDRGWPDAGRDTVRRLASRVRKRAKAVRGHVGVDEVHDMRTATRRLRTAIELHGAEAPRKKRDAVEDELKRVTRRLGAVRDLDILLKELDSSALDLPGNLDGQDVEPLRDAWRAERAAGARRLRAELGRRRFRRAVRGAKRLVARGTNPSDSTAGANPGEDRVVTRAPGLIWDAFGDVLAYEVDPRTANPAAIHELRIAAKKLRYTLEAFEDALEPGATLIDDVKAFQDAAGSMHDGIVAGARARSTVGRSRLTGRQRRAIDAFADAQVRQAERLRPTIAGRLRTIRGRPFRESLARAVAGMGHVRIGSLASRRS